MPTEINLMIAKIVLEMEGRGLELLLGRYCLDGLPWLFGNMACAPCGTLLDSVFDLSISFPDTFELDDRRQIVVNEGFLLS